MNAIVRAWERFWFQGIPAATYAALRILFSVVAIANLVSYTPVSEYWPIDSIAPIPGGGVGLRSWLAAHGLGTVGGELYFWVLLLAFVALALGFWTRVAVVVCFAGTIGQKSWNHLPLTSSVEVITVVLFCLLFVDSGAAFSLDARRRPRRETEAPIWPMRLIQFQVSLLYLNAGLWKLSHPLWRDGTALHYAISHNIFHRFPFPIPEGAAPFLAFGTYATLAWEIGFAFLVWNRWTRYPVLIAGVLIHAGIFVGMEVGSFSWVTLATYIAFLNPWTVASFLERLARATPAVESATATQANRAS
jgi:hypothetical protein